MSIKLMSRIWEDAEGVKGSELLVLLALADYANDDGTSIYPSMQSIGKKARMSADQARRIVHDLIARGFIELVEMGGWDGRRNRSNEYRIVSMGGTCKLQAPSADARGGTRAHASTVLAPMQDDPSYIHHKETSEDKAMPINGHYSTLPGVSHPRKRQVKRDADRIAKERDKLGLTARELTALTNKVLERMNALELADSDTDYGDEEFTQAQQATLALALVGYKTPAEIDRLFGCWPTEDWRGKLGQMPTYKGIVEHGKALGMKQPASHVNGKAISVQRMEGEEW